MDARVRRSRCKVTIVARHVFAFRPPDLALDSFGRREHARRSVQIAIKSFGFSPAGAPRLRARASNAHHDRGLVLRGTLLRRPPNVTLKRTKDLLNCLLLRSNLLFDSFAA